LYANGDGVAQDYAQAAQWYDKAAQRTHVQAQHNLVIRMKSVPNATNLRLIVDSQRLVSAHLARYKQYPADARSRGDGGTATVAFSLSGSGGVTSVRLTRGSGVASIDQEVQAMVRRASPFPAPPDGRSTSFTVPVSFRLN